MIRFTNLDFGYDRTRLFHELHITFESGNVYGLLGMNGAGKSTLLKLMTGLLFPDSGSVEALGRLPAKREPGFLSRVFILPEELNLPALTDREYLRSRAPFYVDFDYDLFSRYIAELDVPCGRKLTALSYGQKKKFLLAFGLASGAALLALDEPTNGLDIPSKGQFRRLVAEATTEQRLFIISTHQVRDVASLIDPLVILHDGKVLLNQTMAQVAARVRMSHSATRPDGGATNLLYSEPAVDGFHSLWEDRGARDGHVDMEILFNMAVSRPDVCRSLFDAEGDRP